jgi:hypothetical protein
LLGWPHEHPWSQQQALLLYLLALVVLQLHLEKS